MGIDACIEVEVTGIDEARLNWMGYDLARRVGRSMFCAHPCLQRESDYLREYGDDDGSDDIAVVRTWMRYWGPGYERGDWAVIRSTLAVLLNHQRVGAIGDLWYFGDCDDRQQVKPWTADEMAEFDAHFVGGDWGYRWDTSRNRLLAHEPDPGTPLDAYGMEMRRNGWGPSFAAYYSPATGETREWRDGVWTSKVER